MSQVAEYLLATVLGLGLRSHHSLEISQYPRHPWLASADHRLCHSQVSPPLKSCILFLRLIDACSLPGAPLWLISIYVPAFEKVNKVWLPPQW